ncbi:hypothetical protein BJX70DRAFT_395111 [Aspergillus crustosus]
MPLAYARQTIRRDFTVAMPARLVNKHHPLKPRGFLAEKGPFQFRERAPSYESVRTQTTNAEDGYAEMEMLRAKVVEQRRTIEALQRTVSDLAGGKKGNI